MARQWVVVTSHSRTVPSSLPEASSRPSGEYASERTAPVCPEKMRMSASSCPRHRKRGRPSTACGVALASVRRALTRDLAVGVLRLLVGLLRRAALGGADVVSLLLPAALDALEAPLRRALAGADRLVVHHHEHRVRVA